MNRLTTKEKNTYDINAPKLNEFYTKKGQDKYIDDLTFDAIQKLGQLEDIEEELGIDLITLFKALKSKELYWNTGDYGIVRTTFLSEGLGQEIGFNVIYDNEWHISLVYHALSDYEKLKDYGKTWALTREEVFNNGNKN